jgi:hypothetical protein
VPAKPAAAVPPAPDVQDVNFQMATMARAEICGALATSIVSDGVEDGPSYIDIEGAKAQTVDERVRCRALSLALFVFLLSFVLILNLVAFSSSPYFSFLPLILLANGYLLFKGSSYAVQYILFPFANHYMKQQYHRVHNESMINEVNNNFQKANTIIQTVMNQNKFVLQDTFREYKIVTVQLKKMCDYAAIFAVVNRELVESDIEKKLRRRKTSR